MFIKLMPQTNESIYRNVQKSIVNIGFSMFGITWLKFQVKLFDRSILVKEIVFVLLGWIFVLNLED